MAHEDNHLLMKLEKICKSYLIKDGKQTKRIKVLSNVSINFYSGKFYVIKGHSGSGKSTLINILGLIDNFDSGKYEIYDTKTIDYSDSKLSNLRMKKIGFVFQSFHLKSTLKAYENVMLPMLINKDISIKERKEKAIQLLKMVGLEDRINHFPSELSGGEQQRVAIARALANDPQVILADEPTGNLDAKNEKEIFFLLRKLANNGKCVIVVSHSNEVEQYADIIYKIENQKVSGDVDEN